MAYFLPERVKALRKFFFCLAFLLLIRLIYLQGIEGSHLALLSLSSRVQEVSVEVSRGEIFDRNGVPLTNTGQNFSVVVFPSQITDPQAAAVEISSITNWPYERVVNRIQDDERPFKLKSDIDAVTAQKINSLKLPGVLVVAERMRYEHASLAAHAIGYINSADNRGVSGIESMYDDLLRGSGPEYVAAMVDAGQNLIPGLGYKRLKLGQDQQENNIVLTLDSRIQGIVERVMDREIAKGAVIVVRPSTGEILAMASRPNFDANNLNEFLGRDTAPLLNRAVVAYQPGSVFKLVAASAALENGVVKPTDRFYDPGYIDVNHLRFNGWDYEKGGHGDISFTDALAYSSNPVFIQVGLKVGAERLVAQAKKFGFGQKTRLNFDGEADGNLPSADSLYPGDIANLSIGQGSLEATPLQIVMMVAALANDGVKMEPYLISRILSRDGQTIKNFASSQRTRVVSRETARKVREMMTAVTTYGTGQAAYVEGFGSAGKTGSAETGRHDESGKGINHAWFAGYAPLERPEYAVVVFVEDGMSGGDIAAPIFQQIAKEVLATEPSTAEKKKTP